MQVYRDLQQLPRFKNAVITIGTFDGVHYGHVHILQQLRKVAEDCKGESVVVTFDPHPREILFPQKSATRLLTTLDEKIELLSQHGIDHLVIVPFTKAFSELSAKEYLENFLVQVFNPHTIIIGYDHRFGHNREGGLPLLEAEQSRYGFQLVEIPQQVVDDLAVSSTKIRNSLIAGDVHLANELLGYPYFLQGTVVHGDKLGRTIGFPTANISLNDNRKLVPAKGVYAVDVLLGDQVFQGALNIGTRPTFDKLELRIEVYIFDFDREIYGESIRANFHAFLREDQKFNSVDSLVEQIKLDVENAKLYFADPYRQS